MKTKLLILMLCFSTLSQAQTTAIPDSNFEQALIDLGHDDVIDGQVLTTNINGLTVLNVSNKNISDLTGIEDFSALLELSCSTNQLTSLDISNNSLLYRLAVQDNNLTNLNISSNTGLTQLFCGNNLLSSLDVSNNTILEALEVPNNLLTSLDLTNNSGLIQLNCSTNQLATLDVSNNMLLRFFTCNFNQLTSLDVSNHIHLERLLCYNNQLSNLNVINTPDLIVLECENNQLTSLDLFGTPTLGRLECNNNQLTSLDVSNNTSLVILECANNQLTNLDVSNSPNLIDLFCNDNDITSLSLPSNTIHLRELFCQNNQLTTLDVSGNTGLQLLHCYNNQINSLDVSSNALLEVLIANDTSIQSLDLSNNTLLWSVRVYNNLSLNSLNIKNGNNVIVTSFDATNTPSLECIQVDNDSEANAGTGAYQNWMKDVMTDYAEDCGDTFVPDDNFEQALIDLGYDSGAVDDYVPTRRINIVASLNVENENISDLTGIEDFRDLEQLRCRNNQIVDLDLSNNTNLTFLRLEDNLLETLNLKNGNNGIITTMRAEDNNLLCVEVDDDIAANAGTGAYSSWQVDNGVVYAERCGGCPEINLLGNGNTIANGDDTPETANHTDFGLVNFGSFVEYTYTIENIGIADLLLAGTPLITITNSSDFAVVAFPDATIASNGGTTSFTIRYTPSMVNTINTATISFMSDDCDNATYSFDVVGQSQEALGIENTTLNSELRIYPNPNNGNFVLKYMGHKPLEQMTIYEITGKQLMLIPLLDFSHQKTFNLKLPTGFYVFKIQAHDESIVKRIIIN